MSFTNAVSTGAVLSYSDDSASQMLHLAYNVIQKDEELRKIPVTIRWLDEVRQVLN